MSPDGTSLEATTSADAETWLLDEINRHARAHQGRWADEGEGKSAQEGEIRARCPVEKQPHLQAETPVDAPDANLVWRTTSHRLRRPQTKTKLLI